jgi:hypothetical protein
MQQLPAASFGEFRRFQFIPRFELHASRIGPRDGKKRLLQRTGKTVCGNGNP